MTTGDVGAMARLLVQAGLISLLMPLVVAIVVQSTWPRRAKEIAAITTSLLAAALMVAASGTEPVNFVIVAPVIAITTQEVYRRFWKPSGIAPWIEDVTTIIKPPAQP